MRPSRVVFAALAGTFFATAAFADPVLYVAAGSANKVLAVDPVANKVIQQFDGIENPHALVTTSDGEYVIAGSLKEKRDKTDAKAKPESTIYIVHPAHGHVMSTMPAVGMIHHQAITPNDRYVISTHPTQGAISYADLEGDGGVKMLKTGPSPNYTVITKDGKTAFVSNSGDGTVSEIDLTSWTVKRQIKVGGFPEHMALSKDEKTLFSINPRGGNVSVISIADGKVLKELDVGKGAHGLGLSEDGKTLFATSKKREVLVAFDLESGNVRELPLSPAPYHLEAVKGTGKVYVSSRKAPKIWVVDPQKMEVVGEIAISGEGHQMALGNL